MPIETDYEPKYIELDDLPIAGPDISYNAEEKRRAAFEAETQLELDTNDGQEISDEELTNGHKTAVMNLGTHVLTHAAADPADVTLGDMEDPGTTTEYSSQYLESYNRIVNSLQESGVGKGNNASVAVNSGSPANYDPT